MLTDDMESENLVYLSVGPHSSSLRNHHSEFKKGVAESCSAKVYHQTENKSIHSDFVSVKIDLIEGVTPISHRIWTWGGCYVL